MLARDGLELLTDDEAFSLLENTEVGRVGLTIGALPAIFPVNYRLIDGAIVFRTAPGTKLEAAAKGAVVAFEIDGYDVAERTGWSVLVVGRSEVVQDLDLACKVVHADLSPYARGVRAALVRIRPELVTGRRIVAEPPELAGRAPVA